MKTFLLLIIVSLSIVVGKRGGKIIIRQDKFPSEGDVLVGASHLEIYK